MKRLELTGKRFGSITVLEFSHLNDRKVSYWKCKCDCGKEVLIRGFALSTGLTMKCFTCSRVKKLEDHTNKKFGRLTALRFSRRVKKETYWIFKCDCGQEKEIGLKSVVNGDVKSCGCYKRERCKELAVEKFKVQRPLFAASKHELYHNTLMGAKDRNLSFNLTEEEFIILTSKNCFYCGRTPSNVHNPSKKELNGHYIYDGLDRVDNLVGYSIENCVPCCTICNNIKHTHSAEIVLNKAEKISTLSRSPFIFKNMYKFENITNKDRISSYNVLYNNYRRVAEKRKKGSFRLSKTEFLNFITQSCYYCGTPPSQYITLYKGRKINGIRCQFLYTGIDRLDNDAEYTTEKCVPCCKYCNDMKRVLPYNIFLEQMKKIYSHTLSKTV